MAFKTFQNGFPLPASDLNNFLMNQSVIVFADVAARTAALPIPVEGMVTYLEDDNELYKWTGADWVNISAPSPVTTEGDLIIGDAGGAATRLAIGAADTVLTSNGTTATWEAAGGGGAFELISSQTLSGASVTFSSIPGTYKSLRLVILDMEAPSSQAFSIKPNGNNAQAGGGINAAGSASVFNFATIGNFSGMQAGLGDITAIFDIANYSDASYKTAELHLAFRDSTAGNPQRVQKGFYNIADTNAITSIEITTGSTFTGGTATLYGVN